MRIGIILFILFFVSTIVQSQKLPVAKGRVYGKIIDMKTRETIPYTPVTIYKSDTLISGVITKPNGEFSLENLPFGKFTLKVSLIGYKELLQTIIVSPQNEEQDLGDIKLDLSVTEFNTMEIVKDKSAVEMNIDRKVFNVEKNIISKGGTAADVVSNIPSVTLDANGNAQLRQNTATIYIDGRPTSLVLNQIPADQIEKIEVITNPSAKFEASTTGGILNIVMKSNAQPGYNGMITGGAGTNSHYNGLVLFNIKQKPIGFSLNYTFNTFKNSVPGYTNRTDYPSGFYNVNDDILFRHFFQSGTTVLDYYINNRNTLTFSENIVMGDFKTIDDQTFEFSGPNNSNKMSGVRQTNTLTHFENYTTKLFYKRSFPKRGKEITADVNYINGSSRNPSDFTTYTYDSSGALLSNNPELQINKAININEMFSFQSDFVNPINDSTKLETGIRVSYKPSNQSLDVSNFNYLNGNYVTNDLLTSYYQIKDLVNAAYINYSIKHKKINYMLGLRVENSFYTATVTNKENKHFLYSYPSSMANIFNSLFPSIFISKKLTEKKEIQFNVTRKINRPNFRQFLPFITASDLKNYSIGNPSITPEFINSLELNYNQYLKRGNFLLTLFFRNSEHVLTQYTYPLSTDSSVLVTTTINGKQANSLGIDNTIKHTLFKGFETTLNTNLFYTAINAIYNGSAFNNNGFNCTGKLIMMYRMPKNFSIQISGNYESKKTVPQGYNREVYFADMAFSKEIKKVLTITLSVRDVFDTNSRGAYIVGEDYIQESWNRRESRFFKLIVNMKFGKGDAALIKRKTKPGEPLPENMDF